MKKIEQLRVEDLKQAFKYIIEQEVRVKLDRHEMGHLWDKFWSRLEDKCSIIETL